MDEYEYVLMAIDEYIAHFTAITICLENYGVDSEHWIFTNILPRLEQLQADYRKAQPILQDAEHPEAAAAQKMKMQLALRMERENDVRLFLKDLKEFAPDVDFEQAIAEYYSKAEAADRQTLETYLLLYPHLLHKIRTKEEEG